jgi:hypothetical protein
MPTLSTPSSLLSPLLLFCFLSSLVGTSVEVAVPPPDVSDNKDTATAGCAFRKLLCKTAHFYDKVPSKGYSTFEGCRAMKATYQCFLDDLTDCLDPPTLLQYNLDLVGYTQQCGDDAVAVV